MNVAARLALAAGCLLTLSGCKRLDMYSQGKFQTWDRSNFFAKQSTMQSPVAGSVSMDEINLPVPQPKQADMAMLRRGQERFNIYCSPCHGTGGDGLGMIVRRGFPQPPSFYSVRLQQAKAQLFYDAITNGYGVMFSYADRVGPADRWAITAYIRALQRSQDTPASELSAADRAQLAKVASGGAGTP